MNVTDDTYKRESGGGGGGAGQIRTRVGAKSSVYIPITLDKDNTHVFVGKWRMASA